MLSSGSPENMASQLPIISSVWTRVKEMLSMGIGGGRTCVYSGCFSVQQTKKRIKPEEVRTTSHDTRRYDNLCIQGTY